MPKLTLNAYTPEEVDEGRKELIGGQSITKITYGISIAVVFTDPEEKKAIKENLENLAKSGQLGDTKTLKYAITEE